MDYQKYFTEKKELYDFFHIFIEDENNSEGEFQTLYSFFNKYERNAEEFKLILHMINNVSNNHYRHATFNSKIDQILSFYANFIKKNFSNSEIFNIFQNNKRILHFLMQNKILIVDKNIANLIQKKQSKDLKKTFTTYFTGDRTKADKYFTQKQNALKNYTYYFYPYIKQFLNDDALKIIKKDFIEPNDLKEFEHKCQIGENDSYVCQLIREDSIKEFIIYVNKNNLNLSSKIHESIYETNPLLMKKNITMIEYAAFFGSIQIFKYLQLNGVELNSSLWLYVIHGNNPEMIHLLEENNIKPENDNYVDCLKESIKCNHNNFANYIIENSMPQNNEINKRNFNENQVSFGFHYHNYEFIHDFDNIEFIFYYACLYDYFTIVKNLVSENKIDLNQRNIIYM